MKKIALILALALGSALSFAANIATPVAPPPLSLPTYNRGVLAAFANSQVAMANLSKGAPTMLQKPGNVSWAEFRSTDYAALLDWQNTVVLSLDVANPNDAVNTYGALLNSNYETLYWGSTQVTPVQVAGVWQLGTSIVQMQLADYIPIPFAGALWAQLVIRDANGYIIDWRNVRVNNGELSFEGLLSGWGDELIVAWQDSSGNYRQTAYTQKNKGLMITPTALSGRTNVAIANQTRASDSSLAVGQTLPVAWGIYYNDQGTTSPAVAHVKIGTANRTVSVECKAYSLDEPARAFKKPISYMILTVENSKITNTTTISTVNGILNATMPIGTFELVPVFDTELFKDVTLPPYDNWGGNGGGA